MDDACHCSRRTKPAIKKALEALNDVPFEARNEQIIKARQLLQNEYDGVKPSKISRAERRLQFLKRMSRDV